MTDPFEETIADQLRMTDRRVTLDTTALAQQVVAARRTRTEQRRKLKIAGVGFAGLIGIAIFSILQFQTSGLSPNAPEQLAHREPAELAPVGSPRRETHAPAVPPQSTVVTEFDLLRMKEDFKNDQAELEALRMIRRQQEWAIARELASRSVKFDSHLVFDSLFSN